MATQAAVVGRAGSAWGEVASRISLATGYGPDAGIRPAWTVQSPAGYHFCWHINSF